MYLSLVVWSPLLGKDLHLRLLVRYCRRVDTGPLRKLDPYLNVDPGTMSPTQHGEVLSPMMVPKPISILAITKDLPASMRVNQIM